jgi:SpoVK/Ycf46/Vps4 family AAA+-type ATPase
MRRNSILAHSWSIDRSDPIAVPNARVAQGLLRCVRRLPGAFQSHQYYDLGEALAPVLEALRPKVLVALKAHRRTPSRADEDATEPDLEDPLLLHDRHVLGAIGEGLARGTPTFRALSDQLDAFLTDFTARHSHPTDRNLQLLGELLSLNEPEAAFLRLAAAASQGSIERNLFAFVPNGARLCKAVEAMCGVRIAQASRMFNVDASLPRSGLLQGLSGGRTANDLEDLLVLTAMGDRLLAVPYTSAAEMAAAVLNPLPNPSPGAALEWTHLERPGTLLAAALSEALHLGTKGINVLLHGAPGTGKTAFVRQMIARIGATGFAIDHRDRLGDEASRSDRLANLRLSQCFAGQHQGAVLVLDEAEDVFQNDYQNPLARAFGRPVESKAWINSLLESNAHPVIWISNEVSHLDPAYLRRFTLCIEFPRTPYSLRHKIAQTNLAGIGCTPETIDAVARDERTSPALLAAATRFAILAQGSGLGPDSAVTTHLEEHAKALGQVAPAVLARRTQRFDTRYLNLAGNMTPEGLVHALKRDPTAALVFCGPPGTGKTQFAAEIAQQLDRQLLVRTASDINSKWYGQSEGNVAAMFRQCDPKTEVLFLDEAEVLLSARESTGHRADRAVTAEFLRWLEVFEGTFICATNHASDFDAALMRRFAFRVQFQPLKPDQRLALFAEQALGWQPDTAEPMPVPDADAARRLARMDLLTPGDFANAGRRARRLGLDALHWLDELESEHAAKGKSALPRIGFV